MKEYKMKKNLNQKKIKEAKEHALNPEIAKEYFK